MNLQRIMALVKMELKKLIREPAYLFLMLLFPAVLTLTFGISFGDPALGMDFSVMTPGLISYACIFIIMTVAVSFTEQREQGLLKRINVTPMTSGEFIGSHMISNMFIAILQVVIVLVLALFFGFRPLSDVVGFILAFLIIALFSLCSVGLGLITATIAKSAGAATGISFIFILPQMFFGTFIPITDTTRIIAMFLPSYYVVDALASIFGGAPLTSENLLIDFAVISIVSVAIIIIGIQLFKKYGNK